MTYEAWRISYQSSEQAARAAYAECVRLRAKIEAMEQQAPSVPREAIEKMLTQLMDIAVSNGANSISMPDEYVEVAAWLCGIPAQPAPSEPVVTPKMEQAFYEKVEVTTVGSIRGLADGIKAAMLAAAPDAKP